MWKDFNLLFFLLLSFVVGDIGQDDGRVNGDCGGGAVTILK